MKTKFLNYYFALKNPPNHWLIDIDCSDICYLIAVKSVSFLK